MKNVSLIASFYLFSERVSSYSTPLGEQRVGTALGSRVDALYTEIIYFIEKRVDPEKLDRVQRWHREPVVSYGFDKADMKHVHNRFDDYFGTMRLEESIELAEVDQIEKQHAYSSRDSPPQFTEERA